MKRKSIAWLLTAVMTVTGVFSSTMLTSGADFSSEPVENLQEFTEETVSENEETELSQQNEENKEAAEEDLSIANENNSTQNEATEQELLPEDEEEEIVQEQQNRETEFFSSDSQDDITMQPEDFDSTMAEKAVEIPYKDLINISQIPSYEKNVFRFTVEKSGKYKAFLSDGGVLEEVYDSSYQKCEIEDGEVINCQAGETYYAVYYLYYVGVNAVAGIFPTIQSFEMKQMPKMDYILWGDETTCLSDNNIVISCTFSNGETEIYKQDDETELKLKANLGDEERYWFVDDQSGTYQGDIHIIRMINGVFRDLYHVENIGQIHVQSLQEMFQDQRSEAEELLANGETTVVKMQDKLFRFTPKEDGKYSFTFESEAGGTYYRNIRLMNEKGEVLTSDSFGTIKENFTAGENYYIAVQGYDDYESLYIRAFKMKKITSITADTSEIVSCSGIEKLYKNTMLDNVGLTITYTDGTSENVKNWRYGTSEGEGIHVDFSSVIFDEDDNVTEGNYTVTISVEDKSTEVKVRALKVADFYREHSVEITEGQEYHTTVDKVGSYYYKLTAQEDGFYTFKYRVMMNGEDFEKSVCDVRAYNSEGNDLGEEPELKAGDTVYIKMNTTYPPEWDFYITALMRKYTLKTLQVTSDPKDKTYIEGIDDTEKPKTDGLKIKAIYSDGVEETLTADKLSRDGETLQINVERVYDENGNIEKDQMKVSLKTVTVTIPLNYMTVSEYISTLNKNSVERLKLDAEKTIQWKEKKGYLYSFSPSQTAGYILNASGQNRSRSLYLYDENGKLLAESRVGLNLKLLQKLNAGKTYYYLVNVMLDDGDTTLKLYKKETVTSANITKPQRTSFIAGTESPVYNGLKVSLTFASGKKATYVYARKDFADYISLSINYENGMKPGNYTLTVKYEDEIIGSIPIKMLSFKDYVTQNPPEELKEGKSVKEKQKGGNQKFYRFTVPETGKYIFKVKGEEEEGMPYESTLYMYDDSGKKIQQEYGKININLKAGKTYYFKVVFQTYIYISDENCKFTVNIILQRVLKEISLSSKRTDLYRKIDDFSEDTVNEIAEKVDITLKFSNGSRETLRLGEKTKDGYYVYINALGGNLEEKTDKFDMAFVCSNLEEKYTIHIHPAMEYLKKYAAKIQLNRKTPVKITAGSSKAYYAVAPETGYYEISYSGAAQPEIRYFDQQGSRQQKCVKAQKGQKFYFVLKNSSTKEISVQVTAKKFYNKITYNLNGGKQNSKNKTTFCKQNVKLYNPTRSGYTFGGWYTDKGLKKKITSITSKTVKNVTLYAKWTKVSKCKAPAGVKAVNSKAKTLTVSYKAASGAKGYEISYSTSAKFSGAKKILTTARSKAIGSLKKGTTYFVRVRAYKTDSTGAKIYGSYSKTVKVTVKK